MKYPFGWVDVRKIFGTPKKTEEDKMNEARDAYIHAIYGTSSGNVTSSTSKSSSWGGFPTTTDKELGTFSIKSVENGFHVIHTNGWKSKSFIASDLESLRDIIVTTLVSNELDK